VEQRQPARLQIRASHDRLAHMAEDLPDVVERWVRAVELGVLGSGEGAAPAVAELVEQSDDGPDRNWVLRVDKLQWSALTVLVNMLRARYDNVYVASRSGLVDRAARLAFEALGFPRALDDLPFQVDKEEPTRASKNRGVLLSLRSPPDDSLADEMIAALDLWAELIVCGGYAEPGSEPAKSLAVPDWAVLYDEVSVSQSFSEGFFADEAAFDAVLDYARALYLRGVPVVSVQFH
jgi:hypothetical protein